MEQPIRSQLHTYAPERTWQARHAFFEEGQDPGGLVDEPILRSWQRCRSLGRDVSDRVEFDAVHPTKLAYLRDMQPALFAAALPELQALARGVTDAGYAVLLTDAMGNALAVEGCTHRHSKPLRQALRPGVDLSERVIGTNAMSAAIADQRLVHVLGPEHFFSGNQIFHCCAAPIFDPQGRVVGAVDISRDMPGLVAGASVLTQHCAHRIEAKLFEAMPAFLKLRLEPHFQGADAWLALERDGSLVGATYAARRLLNISSVRQGTVFSDLFDARFEHLLTAARSGGELGLRLHGGVSLRASVRAGSPVGASSSSPVAARPSALGAREQTPLPVFGDVRFQRDLDKAVRAFNADLPVLITGETGAGKEVAARAVHAGGDRGKGPLVALNCGAIAPQLMAAELFGYADGAYTGARRGGSPGKIEAAHGGTLLLDEIGDMPLELQVGLLRVLDSKEVVRVGGTQFARVDVRFVCATHRDLRSMVEQGRFREDLFYRLSGFLLHVPPLRERDNFSAVLDALLAELGHPQATLSQTVRQHLQRRRWPGNVRELRNRVRQVLALAEKDVDITVADFPEEAASVYGTLQASAQRAEVPGPGNNGQLNLKRTQQQAIESALLKAGGNVAAAAAMLGIGRATLYRRLAGSTKQ